MDISSRYLHHPIIFTFWWSSGRPLLPWSEAFMPVADQHQLSISHHSNVDLMKTLMIGLTEVNIRTYPGGIELHLLQGVYESFPVTSRPILRSACTRTLAFTKPQS